jgi:hypothetical protein
MALRLREKTTAMANKTATPRKPLKKDSKTSPPFILSGRCGLLCCGTLSLLFSLGKGYGTEKSKSIYGDDQWDEIERAANGKKVPLISLAIGSIQVNLCKNLAKVGYNILSTVFFKKNENTALGYYRKRCFRFKLDLKYSPPQSEVSAMRPIFLRQWSLWPQAQSYGPDIYVGEIITSYLEIIGCASSIKEEVSSADFQDAINNAPGERFGTIRPGAIAVEGHGAEPVPLITECFTGQQFVGE